MQCDISFNETKTWLIMKTLAFLLVIYIFNQSSSKYKFSYVIPNSPTVKLSSFVLYLTLIRVCFCFCSFNDFGLKAVQKDNECSLNDQIIEWRQWLIFRISCKYQIDNEKNRVIDLQPTYQSIFFLQKF